MSSLFFFCAGITSFVLIDAVADWLEAIADRIRVENEERRAKLENEHH